MKKTDSSSNTSKKTGTKTAKNSKRPRFPPGWNEKKVQEVIAHYDGQTDEERAAEIEAAAAASGQTLMSVPTELVPDVLELIKRHQRSA